MFTHTAEDSVGHLSGGCPVFVPVHTVDNIPGLLKCFQCQRFRPLQVEVAAKRPHFHVLEEVEEVEEVILSCVEVLLPLDMLQLLSGFCELNKYTINWKRERGQSGEGCNLSELLNVVQYR